MHLLIVGATGGTGLELVTQALERGHDVTAFVRKPSALKMTHERLRVVQGDVMDAASLRQAMAGQDAVLCALGHKRWFYPTRILSQGTANILSAMQGSGVRRLVCETSLGVGDSRGRMGLYYTLFVIPFILPFYYWDKARQETCDSRQQPRLGHRATGCPQQRPGARCIPPRRRAGQLPLDGQHLARRHRGVHARPADLRRVPAGDAGRVLVIASP